LRSTAAACLLAGVLLPAAAGPRQARAGPLVRLGAELLPQAPRRSAALHVSLQIEPTTELVPPPLVEGRLRYPPGLNFQLSGLGIDACSMTKLELFGLQACPPNSLMGYGRAVAELPIKRQVFHEAARIAVVRTDEQAGHPALLLYVYGETGLSAEIVLVAEMLPAAKPYGGLLDIHVPLVPTFTEGPFISLSELSLVIGPENLTYYERIRHKVVAYKPAGIPLPRRCPGGHLPYAIQLRFADASQATGSTAARCPTARALTRG
jgi:hypothetical protein